MLDFIEENACHFWHGAPKPSQQSYLPTEIFFSQFLEIFFICFPQNFFFLSLHCLPSLHTEIACPRILVCAKIFPDFISENLAARPAGRGTTMAALSAKQIKEQIAAAFRARPESLRNRLTELRNTPAVMVCIEDTAHLSPVKATAEVNFMLGRTDLAVSDIEELRAFAPSRPATPPPPTATATSTRVTISDKDDEAAMTLWRQASTRAVKMHRLWDYQMRKLEDLMEGGRRLGEGDMRLVALLSDSAGGAARSAAQMFEVNATRNEVSVSSGIGPPPVSLAPDGKSVIVLDTAVDALTSGPMNQQGGMLPRWNPLDE